MPLQLKKKSVLPAKLKLPFPEVQSGMQSIQPAQPGFQGQVYPGSLNTGMQSATPAPPGFQGQVYTGPLNTGVDTQSGMQVSQPAQPGFQGQVYTGPLNTGTGKPLVPRRTVRPTFRGRYLGSANTYRRPYTL